MNDEVLPRVGQDRALMGQAKSWKLRYFGHVSRHNSLEKDLMLRSQDHAGNEKARSASGLIT